MSTRLVDPSTALEIAVFIAVGQLPGVLARRNQTGAARAIDNPKRVIRYGLENSADVECVVKLDGLSVGRFLALECKVGSGRQRPGQRDYQRAVEAVGGVYVVCRSVDDALAGVERARRLP